MCELILNAVIVGFVNVGPGDYLVQSMNDEGIVAECVIQIDPEQKMAEI